MSAVQEAYDSGQRDFGENKVQEMTEKYEALPKDIRWHMIGHLQRNKVKYIAPYVHLIHAVDSVRLLREIDKEAAKNDRIISCLLQIHIAEETTKFGFDKNDLQYFLENGELEALTHIKVCGLMGMATLTQDTAQISKEFEGLKVLFDEFSSKFHFSNFELTELSMGMSGDYQYALGHDSTMIRVGSSIFGERNYG
jgi:pyridoxal phosphate enzyme (YggS family)